MISLNVYAVLLQITFVSPANLVFVESPSNTTMVEGQSTKLSCVASYTGTLPTTGTISWRKFGELINPETDRFIRGRFSIHDVATKSLMMSNLKIEDVIRSDSGEYSCYMTKNGTSGQVIARSDVATITVLEIPASMYPLCRSSSDSVVQGEQILLSCFSEKVSPRITLSWQYANGTLHEVEYVQEKDTETEQGNEVRLDLRLVAEEETSRLVYTCSQVSPINDPNINRSCNIGPFRMLHKPNVDITAPYMAPGEEAFIVCHAQTDFPILKYTWNLPPSILKQEQNGNIEITDNVMRVINPDPAISGVNVTCNASSIIGSSEALTTLFVTNKPKNDDKDSLVDSQLSSSIHPHKRLIFYASIGCIIPVGLTAVFIICFKMYTLQKQNQQPNIHQPDIYFDPFDQVCTMDQMQSRGAQVPCDLQDDTYIYAEPGPPNSVKSAHSVVDQF